MLTTDFFMPIVDDARDFGRIAATNALSDVYAMGASPIMALAVVGMPVDKLEQLERWVHADFQPDLTLLFDIPIAVARQRLASNVSLDRFEQEQGPFFEKVRQAYLNRGRKHPERFVLIDASKTPEEVKASLAPVISSL